MLLIAGCGGRDEAAPHDAIADVDSAPIDAEPIDPDAMPVGPATIVVTEGGVPKAGVPCAFHDAAGVPIAAMLTDEQGICEHEIGFDHMVTVGRVRATERLLVTYQLVDPGTTVRVAWATPYSSGSKIGSLLFDVPAPVAGADVAVARNGCDYAQPAFGEAAGLTVRGGDCVFGDDQDSLYLEAIDSLTEERKAWTSVSPIAVSGATNVTVPDWSTSFETVELRLVDTPASLDELRLHCYLELHQHLFHAASSVTFDAPVAGQTYADTLLVPPGITTRVQCAVDLSPEASCLFGQLPPYSTMTVAPSDLPVAVEGFVADTVDVTRPRFSWTVGMSGATPDLTSIAYRTNGNGNSYRWSLYLPGDQFSGSASVVAPALPDDPAWSDFALDGTVPENASAANWEYRDLDGYIELLGDTWTPSTPFDEIFGRPGLVCGG
jgi:hypothetical protein